MSTKEEEETADLSTVLSTPIENRIPPDVVQDILSRPPFIPIAGALNIRDIAVAPHVRPGLIFRSGALSRLTPAGKSSLAEQGITTIFDLRSRKERDRAPGPEIDGIRTIWIPSTVEANILVLNEVQPADFVEDGGRRGYRKMHTNILETYRDSFKQVLLHIRDAKDSDGGILYHCTAGKDRTGALSAIIMSLAGTPPAAIARDYALTRVGIEPAQEQLLAILKAITGADVDTPGFAEMCAINAETMMAFLELLDDRWGGPEGYVRAELGLEEADIEAIRRNVKSAGVV